MFERRSKLESEVFFCEQARELLKDKYILIIGDSVQRCVYKDLIALLEDGCLMTENEKRSKMESCYRGDRVVACTQAHNGTNFCQVREWRGIPDDPNWEGRFLIRFIFTTRVYSDALKNIIAAYCEDHFPDVINVQSTFWDITRYGDGENMNGQRYFPQYSYNLRQLVDQVDRLVDKEEIKRLRKNGPKPKDNKIRRDRDRPLKIWRSALPIGRHARGGLLVPEIRFGGTAESFRKDMGFGNIAAQKVIKSTNWDYLDASYIYRKLQNTDNYREQDGVHWNQIAHRWLSFLLLTRISQLWGYKFDQEDDGLAQMFEAVVERACIQRRKYRGAKRSASHSIDRSDKRVRTDHRTTSNDRYGRSTSRGRPRNDRDRGRPQHRHDRNHHHGRVPPPSPWGQPAWQGYGPPQPYHRSGFHPLDPQGPGHFPGQAHRNQRMPPPRPQNQGWNQQPRPIRPGLPGGPPIYIPPDLWNQGHRG